MANKNTTSVSSEHVVCHLPFNSVFVESVVYRALLFLNSRCKALLTVPRYGTAWVIVNRRCPTVSQYHNCIQIVSTWYGHSCFRVGGTLAGSPSQPRTVVDISASSFMDCDLWDKQVWGGGATMTHMWSMNLLTHLNWSRQISSSLQFYHWIAFPLRFLAVDTQSNLKWMIGLMFSSKEVSHTCLRCPI